MYAIIGGVTLDLVKGSPRVNQRIEERSTAVFVVIDTAGALSFQRGQPVSLYDANDTLIFGGLVDKPKIAAMSPMGGLHHELRCIDYHYLADKRLVIASYSTEKAGDIVTSLHTDFLDAEGVTIGEIQEGPELVKVVFNYVSVSEALDSLAEYAGFTWFIDEQKRLYFIDRATNATDWDWSTLTPKPAGGLVTLDTGNPLYRNHQYVRGGTGLTSSLITEDRIGDGSITSFIMGYPLGTTPTVTEDLGPELDIGIRGLDTGKDYYWNKGDNVVTAEVAPANTVAVQIKYYGQYPLISSAINETERAARQALEGGTGLVEKIVEEGWHETVGSSLESSKAKIAAFAQSAKKFTYPTTASGIRPGQLQTIDYPLLGLNNVEMLIESVIMTSQGDNFEIYNITAIVGPVTGSWVKFFSTLIRRQTAVLKIGDAVLLGLLGKSEALSLAESASDWQQEKGQYCWAVKDNGGGLRELRWNFGTWG